MMTLLKHEFIQTRGMLALTAGAALLVTLAGSLLAATGWPAISQIGIAVAVMAVLGLVPIAQILLVVRYWQSSYGRSGYLTQTLPVNGSRIYWAKMTWAWLVSLVGTVLSIGMGLAASPLITLSTGEPLTVITSLREGWEQLTQVTPAWGVVAAVVTFAVMILIWPTQYFFAASIGSQAPMNRWGIGGPVVIYFAVYIAVQIVTFASFVALPLAIGMDGERLRLVRFDLFAEMAADSSSAEVMPIGFVPALVLTTAVCLVWSVRSWKRRVSLV